MKFHLFCVIILSIGETHAAVLAELYFIRESQRSRDTFSALSKTVENPHIRSSSHRLEKRQTEVTMSRVLAQLKKSNCEYRRRICIYIGRPTNGHFLSYYSRVQNRRPIEGRRSPRFVQTLNNG